METLLLKASGPYGIKDSNRFGRDHAKGASRALTFLRKILKTGYLATEDTMHKLKIVFVHARGIKMYFWKLEIPSEDAQVLEHVISTKITTSSNEIGKILGLENFIWKLKLRNIE
ncbi:hypothetical protein RMCBS344292_01338 [Rhizopus microsporus]|nr:hypothetical protein RMCBS344292_01338 [Rhizopus microsporus]